MLFVGDDWAEAHHDVETRRRGGPGAGPAPAAGGGGRDQRRLHALVADHLGADAEPGQVIVGIETDRGPWVQALIGGRLPGVRDQPDAGGPLPGTALDVGGEVATRPTRICWPSWSGWTGRITARSPGTPTWPSTSRCWPARIRR